MKKRVLAIMLIVCVLLSGCAKNGEGEKANIEYKPPELVDKTLETGDKLDLSDEDKKKVETADGTVVALENYTGKFPVVTDANAFTVLNLNLDKEGGEGNRSYAERNKALMTLLLKANPDIITFQEAGNAWMNLLVPQLKDIYDYYLIYPNKKDQTTANPIFFKIEKFSDETGGCFWLSETPEAESAARNGKYYNCTWLKLKDKKSGNSLYVFNSQMEKEISAVGAERIREKCQMIGWKQPIICNMDLGGSLDSPAGETLLLNLRNANTGGDKTATYHQYSEKKEICDFSLYTKVTVTPKLYQVLTDRPDKKAASDHNPIVVEYVLNTENLNYSGEFIF